MNRTNTEQFFLLSLHPEKAKFAISNNTVGMGIAAAILFDLAEEKCIDIEKDRLMLIKSKTKLSDIHQSVLDDLTKKKRPPKLSGVLISLSNKSRKTRQLIAQNFIKEGQVLEIKKKFIFFQYNIYKLVQTREHKRLYEEIKSIIMEEKKIEDTFLPLVILAHLSHMERLFTKDRKTQKRIRKHLDQIIKDDAIGKGMQTAIRNIQAAIATTAISASIVTTSH